MQLAYAIFLCSQMAASIPQLYVMPLKAALTSCSRIRLTLSNAHLAVSPFAWTWLRCKWFSLSTPVTQIQYICVKFWLSGQMLYWFYDFQQKFTHFASRKIRLHPNVGVPKAFMVCHLFVWSVFQSHRWLTSGTYPWQVTCDKDTQYI